MRLPFLAAIALTAFGSASCVNAYKQSVGGDTEKVVSRVYITDFDVAWQAVLDALKHNRLDVSNREGGFIQTRWTENTDEKNFVDSFGNADAFLKSQYRFRVTVAKGYSYERNKQGVKVTVQKEQLVQRDVLEGWRAMETEPIEENTLLYRIGRLIFMKLKLARLEDEKTKRAIEQSGF
jgi:hypothetical protein